MSTVLPQKLAAVANVTVEVTEAKDLATTSIQTLPLGKPRRDRNFIWEKRDSSYDPDDTATQVRDTLLPRKIDCPPPWLITKSAQRV